VTSSLCAAKAARTSAFSCVGILAKSSVLPSSAATSSNSAGEIDAEALLVQHPLRTSLTETEIKQVADYFYALQLHADEELRVDGVGDDPLFASIQQQLSETGIEVESPFSVEKVGSGLSDRMMHKIDEGTSIVLPALKKALARGNVEFIRYELNEVLRVLRNQS
jgi:hypothetical protein